MTDYSSVMTALPPILTAHLFEELDERLIELLESLSPSEWQLSTIVPAWNVKQIAAHLLDTALRRLSLDRDNELASHPPIKSPRDLADLVNALNARGVEIYGRLSARVLIALMRVATRELHEYFRSMDPDAPARFAVSWAGEAQSATWFDIAREFTERWHHQQQIRLAVNRPGIMTPHLYRPVLDCFMRALPYTYRDVPAQAGSVAQVRIDGASGGDWFLSRDHDCWTLSTNADAHRIVSTTTIPEEIAWRIFTKGIDRENARQRVAITGDEQIGSAVLGSIAIVA
jgi:uncharacterized protein (TIGR03083 family)